MILPIILFVLIVIVISAVLTFLFYVLLPSLKKQGYDVQNILISKEEKSYIDSLNDTQKIEKTQNRALVLCSCYKKFSLEPINLNEMNTCFMVKKVYGSNFDCKYACIGLGDCAKVCPQNAIEIKNKTAIVTNLCVGCSKCAEVCPQNIIKMVPKNTTSYVLCNFDDSENELTSCSEKKKEQKVEWNDSKHFKIWAYWYRIIKKHKK